MHVRRHWTWKGWPYGWGQLLIISSGTAWKLQRKHVFLITGIRFFRKFVSFISLSYTLVLFHSLLLSSVRSQKITLISIGKLRPGYLLCWQCKIFVRIKSQDGSVDLGTKCHLAVPKFSRKLGRVSNFNKSINWYHHMKDHDETGHLTKYDAF